MCKNVNRFVSVNCSVQRKRSHGNLVFIFFICLIDLNKFFEKHLLPLKHVYSSCSVEYGFNINKHTFA